MFIIRNLPDALLRFRPDAAPSGGSSPSSPQGGDPGTVTPPAAPVTPPATPSPAAPEIAPGIATLLNKHGNDSLKVMEILHGDNFQLREKNRQLQSQIDGALILRDGDKTAYEQYRALGAPGEIATKLRQGELERVAGKAGYNPTVFADLDRMAGGKIVYEAKTEEVDGAQVERFYVRDAADPNATPQLLSDYAAAKWANYLPSLQPAASQGQNGNGTATTPLVTPAPGLRFPTQHPGGGAAPVTTKTVAENTLDKAYKPRKPAAS